MVTQEVVYSAQTHQVLNRRQRASSQIFSQASRRWCTSSAPAFPHEAQRRLDEGPLDDAAPTPA